MASKSPNLKVNVNSDTSGFTKGMSTAKKELNAFEKTSSDALGKIAGAFGINTAQVQRLQEAFAGAGRKVAEMGGEGSKALGQIVASAGKAATAIGAIGIGAAVTAFKLLNEEATTFKNTVEGANIELQTQAYLETYRQAMHDYKSETGRTVAETLAELKKTTGSFFQNVKTFGVTALTDQRPTAIWNIAHAWSETAKAAKGAKVAGEEAAELAGVIYDLQRRQADKSREWAEMERQIAEYRRLAADTDESEVVRLDAINKAKELINRKSAEQYDLQLMISDLTDLINNKASSGAEAIDQANNLYNQAQNTLEAMNTEMRSFDRLARQIANSAKATATSYEDASAAIARGVERQQEAARAQIELFVSDESREALQGYATKPIEVPVRLKTEEVQQQLLDLNEVVQGSIVEAVEGISEALGNLIGNLANGEGGVAQFGQDMLEMFGGFAQKFGKVLVAFGVAVEAAKLSAESFNGIAAIAAGAALIAAGAAVKTIASNMASSMGSGAGASSYVASSSYGGGGGYANSTLQVEVSGTLTANGSQLVAVLNNENNRKSYTT